MGKSIQKKMGKAYCPLLKNWQCTATAGCSQLVPISLEEAATYGKSVWVVYRAGSAFIPACKIKNI